MREKGKREGEDRGQSGTGEQRRQEGREKSSGKARRHGRGYETGQDRDWRSEREESM